MWIQTFTSVQVQEIHQRLHRRKALIIDYGELEQLCEGVNIRSRCKNEHGSVADAIQVAADYFVTLKKPTWIQDHQQSLDTAFITALTYLRLSNYVIDCENPAIWYLISQSQDRKLVENVFFAALTESHVSLDTSEHRARHRGRLPLTHLGVDNHRWAARLRMFVDESYERCCLTAPGYVWQEHEQAVREYHQQAHARLKQSLASGFFN